MTPDGPVAPLAREHRRLSALPFDALRLSPDGRLGQWQARNRDATIPHCLEQLETSGTLGNLRRVLDGGGEFRGMWFADSDVYKTLEAVGWQAGQAANAAAASASSRQVADVVRLLGEVQQDDGYLNSWFQTQEPDRRWTDLLRGHEMYCAGHLVQAGIAWARTTGETTLLDIGRRFADLLVRRFGAVGTEAVCGHPEIEMALVELYRHTGDRSYLDLASRMVDLRGHGLLAGDQFGDRYLLDHVPVRELTTATGHAVRLLYLATGATDVYLETGDPTLLAAMERLWDDIADTKTYISGGHGSRHRDESFGDAYELPADRAYAESCAAIASFMWNWRLLLATGRARYADEMERTLHNAVAVATSADGTHFFYSNPLHLRPDHGGSTEDAPSARLAWYTCACCPPNLARLVASLHHYLVTTDGTGVQLQLLSAGSLAVDTPATGAVRLETRTDYPWDGRVEIEVTQSDPAVEWTLSVRVPPWAKDTTATLSGEPLVVDVGDGYLRVRRRWSPGDRLELDLPMRVQAIRAHPRVDSVRGCVALVRGPVLFCVEQVDHDVPVDDLRLDPADLPTVSTRPPAPLRGPAPTDVPLPVPPMTLVGRATCVTDAGGLYRTAASRGPARFAPLTAVPYSSWGNRGTAGMRVWIPCSDPRTTQTHQENPC